MRVFAKIPMGYNGKELDRGEIFDLVGLRNDSKLVGLKMVLPFDPKIHRIHSCHVCSRQFAAEQFLTGHRKKPDCNVASQEPTRAETADILEVDVDKIPVDSSPLPL
jgi:hypothetical protein